VAKLSLTCTRTSGCATAEEREKIRYEFLTHTLDTCGRFGYMEERSWPYTIGVNKKGGMTDE
jgi:hypothetical protein